VPAAFCFARVVLIRPVILALLLWAGAVRAQDVVVISAEELDRAPSAARIAMLVDLYCEKIRVFKAGVCLNTLAWNNGIGLRTYFVGF